ncbi:MAG TPA: hypothetical protein VGD33_08360 [Chitinophagaceae bacterium]
MHNYSPEDLIRYMYKETSPELTAAIEEALKNDWTLREKLTVLKASSDRLNTIIESPSTRTVLNILKYAAEKEVINS